MASSPAPDIPIRTCIGCRRRAPKPELLRVVGKGAAVVPDPRFSMPGRGAYLHPDRECFDLAVRRRAFGRALRIPAGIDVELVATALARPHDNHLGSTG